MATIVAVLHHKFPDFFWTGFYLLKEPLVHDDESLSQKAGGVDGDAVKNDPKMERDLVVGPYQGPVACQVLERHKGVCWAAIDRGETIVVPDVHQFPGHIACDSRSNSEIVIPLPGPDKGKTGRRAGEQACKRVGKEADGEEVSGVANKIGPAERQCIKGEIVSEIVGVLDIDSERLGTFDKVDAEWLEAIVRMAFLPASCVS